MWEWTSTAFDAYDGFKGTAIFPGFSSDFFDQKHHVIVSAKFSVFMLVVTVDDSRSLVGRTQRHRDWLEGEPCGISSNTITRTRGRRRGSRMMYNY